MTTSFTMCTKSFAHKYISFWRPGLLVCALLCMTSGVSASESGSTTSVLQQLCPVAAGNSWLSSCLRDLGFPAECIVRVVEPGTCPGHYDIRPSHAQRLRTARAAVFFDFQAQLARRLEGSVLPTAPMIISPRGGLCVPSTYRAALDEIAAKLSSDDPATSRCFTANLETVKHRLTAIEKETLERVADSQWRGTPIVASVHQREFCEWLGMRVVATLPTPDKATPANLEKLISDARGARVVATIANLQEGTRAAEAVAEALRVPVIVFSNFPSEMKDEPGFVALVRHNVDRLLAAQIGERK